MLWKLLCTTALNILNMDDQNRASLDTNPDDSELGLTPSIEDWEFYRELQMNSNISVRFTTTVPPSIAIEDIIVLVRFYLIAIVIIPGLLFNLLSCAVFLQARLQKSPTVHYFLALACADSIVLSGELLAWLNIYTSKVSITGLTFMDEVDGMCEFVVFLKCFGRSVSSWLVVTICIERFLAVAHPLKIASWSTTRKVRLIIILLSVVCFAVTVFPVFPVFLNIHKPGYRTWYRTQKCVTWKNHLYWIFYAYVRTIFETIIPTVLVAIFTTLIICKLRKAQQQQVLAQEGQRNRSPTDSDKQATIALIAVALTFVILRTPFSFVYPMYMHSFQAGASFMWAANICFLLEVLNYAINFFLYVVTGSTFRQEFKRFILCKQFRHRSVSFPTRSPLHHPARCTNAPPGNQDCSPENQNCSPRNQDCSPGIEANSPGECIPICQDTQV